MVFHWSLSDSKSQVFRTILSILGIHNNAVVWMFSTRPLTFKSLSNHHHHHVVLVVGISLTLSRHFSLSFIASGRSSGLHPVSSHSCWMYVRAGRPAFARPCVGVHISTSLMSSSLLLQQCPACLVRLTWIVFVIGGRWPYSWCLVGCCRQDLFKSLNIYTEHFFFKYCLWLQTKLYYIYIYIYILSHVRSIRNPLIVFNKNEAIRKRILFIYKLLEFDFAYKKENMRQEILPRDHETITQGNIIAIISFSHPQDLTRVVIYNSTKLQNNYRKWKVQCLECYVTLVYVMMYA